MGALSIGKGFLDSVLANRSAKDAANQIKENRKVLDENMEKTEREFNQQYYRDLVDSSDVQNMLRILSENQDKQRKRNNAQAAVTGKSSDQVAADNESMAKSYADAIASISSNARAVKDQYLANFQNQRAAYANGLIGTNNQIAGVYNNMAAQQSQAASNAFMTGGKMLAGNDWDKTKQEWQNMRNSRNTPPSWNTDGIEDVIRPNGYIG